MKRVLFYVACSIPIISMILLIMCGELPTDPKNDPDNVTATFFSTISPEIYYQDQPVEIGIIIRYPALTKRIRVTFGDNLPNDTLFCDAPQSGTFDTVKTIRTFSDSGKKIINVDVDLTSGSVKQFKHEIKITPKQLTVSFDTVPSNEIIETGKPDTMTFTASTSPAGGAIVFTVESQPVLDLSSLKINTIGSKAQVITTAPKDTIYNITVTAKSGTATKSSTVKLTSKPKLILKETSSVSTMLSGASDTLVFTIGATQSDVVDSVIILNKAAFKPGEIERVVKGKDTLSFIFTPTETKVYTFSVEVTINNVKDTISYSLSVTKETTLLLKRDTLTISATEGEVLNVPLVSYLADTTVQLSVDKGTVNGKSLAYTVPSGRTKDTVIITAQKNSNTSRLKIYLNISKSDTSKFTVTYIGNGNTAGSVLVDTNKYGTGASVTAAAIGTLVKTGSIFTGWNTVAAGTGTAIAAGGPFAMGTANVTLYAQWTTNPTFSVTYNGNGSTGGTAPVDANNYETGTTVAVAAVGTLVKTGSTFTGWNTVATGTGTARAVGGSFAIGTANVTLFAQWTTNPTFSVTYNGNGSTGGTATVDANNYEAGATVTVAAVGTLVKTGSTFTGWNTVATGTGTARAAGGTFAMGTENVILFAQWTTNPTFSVTYNGNGSTGGTAPVDANNYETGATVTVASAGTLVKTGFSFTGWNTVAVGTGTARAAGGSFAAGTENVTLYAQWTTNPTFTVTYNGTGSTGGIVPVDPSNYETGGTVNVASPGTLVKTGSAFAGWNTVAAGTGTARAVGGTFAMGTANVTLYAQWTTNPTFTVTYNGNGSTGGTVPVDLNHYETGGTVTVAAVGTLVKTGSTFAGWNTVAAGTGTARAAGGSFAMGTAIVTLYAQWTTIPTFTVTYNGNGSTGGIVPVDANNYETGANVTVAAVGTLVKTGSTFAGWNTVAAGTGTASAAGGTFAMGTAIVTLYAQWTTIPTFTVTYNGNGSTSGNVPVDTNHYETGANVTVAAVGTLVKTGSTFAGWNTVAVGTGTARAAGGSFAMGTAIVTLYAQWTTIPTFTVTYNGNGSTGGNVPVDANNYETGANVTVAAVGTLVKTGSSFAGWNTVAAGTGTARAAGGSFAMGTAIVVLYAQWNADPIVTYNANGATGTPPASSSYKAGATVTVAGIGSLSKARYVFDGWNTQADGRGTKYNANQTFPMGTTNIPLYARWAPSGMVKIQSGTFEMGQTDVSTPVHTVTLTKNYWMNQTEITQKEYSDLMTSAYGSSISIPDWSSLGYGVGDNYPAYGITWDFAILFCNAKTRATGSTDTVYRYTAILSGTSQVDGIVMDVSKSGFRLPSEAEWEYACRAGSTTNFFWGNSATNIDTYVWYADNSNERYSWVSTLAPNAWNLYDMLGSVAEWCNDYYYIYTAGSQVDPLNVNESNFRMLRGGSITSYPDYNYLDCAHRSSEYSYYGAYPIGFRVSKNCEW